MTGTARRSPPRAGEAPLAGRVAVIAHRGASALFPEHTLAAYARAIEDGADFIEPDLVATRDGVLVARHENEIGSTTDVAVHPEFAGRRTRKSVDGRDVEGWFSEDFTLEELRTLRARERLPALRGTRHDGRWRVPTLAGIIDLAARAAAQGRAVGIIPELKHGSYFAALGLALEERLLAVLDAHAYTRHAPVEVQSFETTNLRALRRRLGSGHPNVRLLQLLGAPDAQPRDAVLAGSAQTYGDMMSPAGLSTIARYADAVGPEHTLVVPVAADGLPGEPTLLVGDAHAAGLEVHAWTFRPENFFLPRGLWEGDDPAHVNAAGSIAEIRACLAAGIDAFFTDAPAIGRRALDAT